MFSLCESDKALLSYGYPSMIFWDLGSCSQEMCCQPQVVAKKKMYFLS